MNQHLHLHIKETMTDYGPSHAFWCFPFEGYNGILGSYTTHKKAVEVQFMKRFTSSQSITALSRFSDPQLCSLLPNITTQSMTALIPTTMIGCGDALLDQLHNVRTSLIPFKPLPVVEVIPPICELVLLSEEVQQLECLYNQLFRNSKVIFISPFFQPAPRISLAGDLFGSMCNGASASTS